MTPTEIRINEAKQLVCNRYNETKRPFDPLLQVEDITTLTTVVEPYLIRILLKVTTKKLLYEVLYNNNLHEFYVNSYKKIDKFDYRKE